MTLRPLALPSTLPPGSSRTSCPSSDPWSRRQREPSATGSVCPPAPRQPFRFRSLKDRSPCHALSSASRSISPHTSRGVNNTTVWADPDSKSQIDFSSFLHLARTAERGKFDFFFLAEGLRLREHRGRIHDLDVVGRPPDTLTVLEALAGATTHLGLAGTINTTFNEPYEVAKQFATLDHLSEGRAAWNLVTSSDAFTGENFRRGGGFLDHSQRYVRAHEVVDVARSLWDGWRPGAPVVDRANGIFAADTDIAPVRPAHHPVRHHRAFRGAAQPAGLSRVAAGR